MIKSDSCSNRKEHFTVSDLDALVLEEIKKLALDPASLDVLVEESAGEAPPDLEAFRERLGNVEKQITRLLNLYQTGIVGLEEIQDRLSVLKEERKAAQNCLDEAEAEDSGKMSKGEAAAALASLSGIIEAGDSDGLFALVHSLIEKVVVLNGNVTIYWAFC